MPFSYDSAMYVFSYAVLELFEVRDTAYGAYSSNIGTKLYGKLKLHLEVWHANDTIFETSRSKLGQREEKGYMNHFIKDWILKAEDKIQVGLVTGAVGSHS